MEISSEHIDSGMQQKLRSEHSSYSSYLKGSRLLRAPQKTNPLIKNRGILENITISVAFLFLA